VEQAKRTREWEAFGAFRMELPDAVSLASKGAWGCTCGIPPNKGRSLSNRARE